jgi:hypothetical protein
MAGCRDWLALGESAHEVAAFWTVDRLAAARPYCPAAPTTPRGVRIGESRHPHYSSTPLDTGTDDPFAADPGPPTQAPTPVPVPTRQPWRCIGLLYFQVADSPSFGTAFVIGTHTLLTAGHLLFPEPGRHATHLLFVPAAQTYRSPPFGVWYGSRVAASPQWRERMDRCGVYDRALDAAWTAPYDYGLVDTSPGEGAGPAHPARAIGDCVGTLPLVSAGWGGDASLPPDPVVEVGYPMLIEVDGRYRETTAGTMYRHGSPIFEVIARPSEHDDPQRLLSKESAMALGNSGAPWLARDPGGDGTVVAGLTGSGGYGVTDSPAFDRRFHEFIRGHVPPPGQDSRL